MKRREKRKREQGGGHGGRGRSVCNVLTEHRIAIEVAATGRLCHYCIWHANRTLHPGHTVGRADQTPEHKVHMLRTQNGS
eukprot:1654822-Rhodomonas_salina.2